MNNAICMLIFENNIYVPGACLSAYVHRKFIEKNNEKISLLVMVDKVIYKYKDELDKYFDKVILIDLLELKLHPKYYIHEKYSKWMKYSINKWQILKFTNYKKILFIDIDILPIKDNFYKVFNINTPGFIVKGNLKNNIEIQKNKFLQNKNTYFDMKICSYFSLKLKYSIDAGLVLLSPDILLYNEYIDFLNKCAGINGYISHKSSGIDETSLLLFYVFYKKIKVYSISYSYAVIPWEKYSYNKNEINGINYLAMIKPWTILPMLQWGEQNIWHIIAKKALIKSKVVADLYIEKLLFILKEFIKKEDEIKNKKNNPYNIEGVNKKENLIKEIKDIYISNHKLNNDNIKKIMILAKEIHKYMNKDSLINLNLIVKLIKK